MKETGFDVRPATLEDKARILAISGQIWEGEDYIPNVVDAWLSDPDSQVIAAFDAGHLIAFARFSWFFPGYAWFEGIRADPQHQNRGAGKAVLRYMLAKAEREGAQRVGLSTYITNDASIRIVETHGFVRVASFVYLGTPAEAPRKEQARPSSDVVTVPAEEALAFIIDSPFLAVARGHFPHGWKFYPFALGPARVFSGMPHIWGIRRGGRLSALLCSGRPLRGQGEFSVDFVDGDPGDMASLLRHALYVAGDASVEVMVPVQEGSAAAALDVSRGLGFQAWFDYRPDVFVYEREMAS